MIRYFKKLAKRFARKILKEEISYDKNNISDLRLEITNCKNDLRVKTTHADMYKQQSERAEKKFGVIWGVMMLTKSFPLIERSFIDVSVITSDYKPVYLADLDKPVDVEVIRLDLRNGVSVKDMVVRLLRVNYKKEDILKTLDYFGYGFVANDMWWRANAGGPVYG